MCEFREGTEGGSMKSVLSIVLLGCLASGLPARNPMLQIEDINEVKKAVADLVEVQLRYDVAAVDKLLDNAFIYVAHDGSLINRADFLKLTDRQKNPLDLLTVTDINVTVSNDAAIATGIIHEKGSLDDKPYEFRGRTLATYVKKNGRWLCFAIHD
jgi:ketosteroid isomerase-like protein